MNIKTPVATSTAEHPPDCPCEISLGRKGTPRFNTTNVPISAVWKQHGKYVPFEAPLHVTVYGRSFQMTPSEEQRWLKSWKPNNWKKTGLLFDCLSMFDMRNGILGSCSYLFRYEFGRNTSPIRLHLYSFIKGSAAKYQIGIIQHSITLHPIDPRLALVQMVCNIVRR